MGKKILLFCFLMINVLFIYLDIYHPVLPIWNCLLWTIELGYLLFLTEGSYKDKLAGLLTMTLTIGILTWDNLSILLSSWTYALIIYLLIWEVMIAWENKKRYRKPLEEKKITILALHLGYGGIEQYLSSLCKMLEKKYEIEILATYKVLENPAFPFSERIKIKYLINDKPNKEEFQKQKREKKYGKMLKEGIKVVFLLYKKKYENIKEIRKINSKYIITTRDFHNDLVGKYARRDITKIATEHNYHNHDSNYIKKVIHSVKKLDYFVLVSESLCDFYSDKVKPTCIYIPNVIDKLPKKYSNCNNHALISIGRFSKEKGQLDLIDVVARLKEEYSDAKLYLIGDGEEKNRIVNEIKAKNLSKNVVLTGFLSKNDIELKMLESSVFVTTSYTESFGLVVLEACSYKLPVVAFDSATGVKKLLENGNGVLIENRDKEKMKCAIKKLWTDSKYKEKIAQNGYENCKKYLPDNVQKMWFDILK